MKRNFITKLAWVAAGVALVSCGDSKFRASAPVNSENSLTNQQAGGTAAKQSETTGTGKDQKGNSFDGTPTAAEKLDYNSQDSSETTQSKPATVVTMDQRPGGTEGAGTGTTAGSKAPKTGTSGTAAGDDAFSFDAFALGKGAGNTQTSTGTTAQTTQPQVATQPQVTAAPPPPPPPAIVTCTRTVTKTFTDGIGIKINSQNHPNSSEDGQCNTSCHWANQGFSGCATRDCRAPGTNNDSLCTQCVYTKEVQETYQCQ
jgi:hypothetical protein